MGQLIHEPLYIGMDVGSTTVKAVVVRADTDEKPWPLISNGCRHPYRWTKGVHCRTNRKIFIFSRAGP